MTPGLLRLWSYLLLGVTGLVGGGSEALFLLSFAVTGVSMAHRVLLAMRGAHLSPIAMWELGYLWVLGAEWLLDREELVRVYGSETLAHVTATLIAGHATVVILADRHHRRSSARSRSHASDVRSNSDRSMHLSLLGTLVVCVVGLLWVPTGVSAGLAGRAASVDGSGSGAIGTLALAGALLAPTLLMKWYLDAETSPAKFIAAASMIPFLAATAISGTRFYLLFAVLGPLGLYVQRTKPSGKQTFRLVAAGLLLIVATSWMLGTRQGGLGAGADDSSVLDQVLHSEAVIASDAAMVRFFEDRPYRDGETAGAVLTAFVPRAVWDEKPTLLGYWMPRQMGASVSAAHSNSYGFIGEGYADAGRFGALAECVLIGLAIGILSSRALRGRGANSLDALFGALAYPISFFAVRSPVTTLVLSGAMIGYLVLLRAMARIETRITRRPLRGRLQRGGELHSKPLR